MSIAVKWIDGVRESKNGTDPAFPDGVDVDASDGADTTCAADLPYPAKRRGNWFVQCSTCAQSASVATNGRPDDPRSVKLACNLKLPRRA